MTLYNLARVYTATTGTGTLTLGAPVTGFLSFSGAGVADGSTVSYGIRDENHSEVGRGVWDLATNTLTRATVLNSTLAGAKIPLSGSAQVAITALAQDFAQLAQPVDYAQFNTAATPIANVEGLLQWNAADGTLDLGMSGGAIAQQIGQEMFIKVRNVSGSTIANGTPVYFSGRTGNRPNIYPAKADAESTSVVMGLTTQDIDSPADGYITSTGYVRQIKTNYSGSGIWGTTWNEGDDLYISKTNAGQLTNVEPTKPHHSDIIGNVGVLGAAGVGSILVNIHHHRTIDELSNVSIATPADAQVLKYEAASGTWKNGVAGVTGTGVSGRIAAWDSTTSITAGAIIPPASNVLTITNAAASTLALNITNSKTLTLTAADNYTLTIPATGTAALLATANVFTALQTVDLSSTSALLVENSAGNRNVLRVDTTNGRVTINTSPTIWGLTDRLVIYNQNEVIVRTYSNTDNVTYTLQVVDSRTMVFQFKSITTTNIHGEFGFYSSVKDLIFKVITTGGSLTERLRISNGGVVTISDITTTKGRRRAVVTKTADYTATTADEIIRFTSNATLTLPAATATGQTYTVIADGCTVVVDGNGSETINNQITQTLYDGDAMDLHDTASGKWNIG